MSDAKRDLGQVFTDWRAIPVDHSPCVYMLVDPKAPRAPRYIGASRSLSGRLRSHQKPSGTRNAAFASWLRNLRSAGRAPALVVLQTCASYEEARRLEWRLISRWTRRGIALLSLPTMSIEERYIPIAATRRRVTQEKAA